MGQLDSIEEKSTSQSVVIFKHSTRCSISHMAKGRLDRYDNGNTEFYYLDLIAHRDISNEIASRFQVHHESPQILIIKNGECIYAESHSGIIVDELEEQLEA
jgi:bacillithiol system protein YtxJ